MVFVARRSDTRDRMVAAALELFGRRGYHATAFSDVVAAGNVPRGSIYFHFPGGKEELARAVSEAATVELLGLCDEAAAQAAGPAEYVRALVQIVAERLVNTGYERGCAVATMVLELAPHAPELQATFGECFGRWRTHMAGHLAGWGIRAEEADAAAIMIMSTIEGALLIARALGDTEPLYATAERLVAGLPKSRRRARAVSSPA
jgi:TetR/AcrR family transcriptional repressor of lmrAB and yxaGH operons